MTDDSRCCGTGTCIINEEGLCWCGQKWDGEKMCFPHKNEAAPVNEDATKPSAYCQFSIHHMAGSRPFNRVAARGLHHRNVKTQFGLGIRL